MQGHDLSVANSVQLVASNIKHANGYYPVARPPVCAALARSRWVRV